MGDRGRMENKLGVEKQKEYQRQQEKLRAMVSHQRTPVPVSADVMIEDLLKDKETFKKYSGPPQHNTSYQNTRSPSDDYPVWLRPGSSLVPQMYRTVWSLVQRDMSLCDTQLVSRLLMTSNLHTDVLGFIWNMANKSVAGKLTQFELYLVLALVGLAQSGCTFNNLNILNLIPSPPIPSLNMNVLQPVSPVTDDFQQFQSAKLPTQKSPELVVMNTISSTTLEFETSNLKINQSKTGPSQKFLSGSMSLKEKNLEKDILFEVLPSQNFPLIGSSPTKEQPEEDEFSDFQCSLPKTEKTKVTPPNQPSNPPKQGKETHNLNLEYSDLPYSDPYSTVIISQKRDISKLSLPKLNSLKLKPLKISPESEKKLKSLTQSDILTALPESKISSSNLVSTLPGIAVVGGNADIGSRLANHAYEGRSEKPKHCQKCYKSKVSPITPIAPVNVEELFSKSQTLSNSAGELFPRVKNSFLLKDTKIRTTSVNDDQENNEVIEGAKCDTHQIKIPGFDAIPITRLPTQVPEVAAEKQQPTVELLSVEEDKYSALRGIQVDLTSEEGVVDEFGDFLSANVPVTDPSDFWREWTTPDSSNGTTKENESIETQISSKNSNQVETDFFSSMENFSESVPKNDNTLKASAYTFPSESNLLGINSFELSSTSINTSLSWEEKLELYEVTDKREEVMNGDDEFGEFVASNLNAPPGVLGLSLSRHSSLPSLDLKMSPGDDAIVRKCLDCCVSLLQNAVDLFTSVSSSVLDEVFTTQQAKDYLRYLAIVYYIGGRVQNNKSEVSDTANTLQTLWSELDSLSNMYNLQIEKDVDSAASSKGTQECSICLSGVGMDTVKQGDAIYHPTCANLWVNCIETSLPCQP